MHHTCDIHTVDLVDGYICCTSFWQITVKSCSNEVIIIYFSDRWRKVLEEGVTFIYMKFPCMLLAALPVINPLFQLWIYVFSASIDLSS